MALSEPRNYESIVIFNPRLGESQLNEEIKRYEGVLTSNGAKDVKVENWGRKETSYLMKKERYGQYVCFKYESTNHEAPNVLASLLRIADSVNKFQTHVLSSKVRKVKVNPKRAERGSSGFSDFDDDGLDSFE